MTSKDAKKQNDHIHRISAGADEINHPPHYTKGSIECIDYMEDKLGSGFGYHLEGNILKYMPRWRHKHDSQDGRLTDLRKTRYYLDKLIADVEKHDVPICHD